MLVYKLSKRDKDNIIIFIHGFTGSKDTWVTEDNSPKNFIKFLFNNNKISENFDYDLFVYDTILRKDKNSLFDRFSRIVFKKNKNLNINKLAEILVSEVSIHLKEYKNIILICHSMGGLIAKSAIIKMIENNTIDKIRFYFSIAVPHNGSDLASYGRVFLDNVQIDDLNPIGETIKNLNEKWLTNKNLPNSIFFSGANDEVVVPAAAVPLSTMNLNVIHTTYRHEDIINPNKTDVKHTVVVSIQNELINFLESNNKVEREKSMETSIIIKNSSTMDIDLHIVDKIDNFDNEKQIQLLKTIAMALGINLNEIEMKSIKEGSVKVTLSIPKEKYNSLIQLVESGSLNNLNILYAQPTGSQVIINAPVKRIDSDFKAGDTVSVHVKIAEDNKEKIVIFDGVVIQRRNAGMEGETFKIRKISNGVGYERIFPLNSPSVEKIEVLRRGVIRRAKLSFAKKKKEKEAKAKMLNKRNN